ncbi:histone-fold-containing protein [Piromyces finnis]|uniref:Histone-fold-containing protein n=1 Tax=Piromyces finnis TaxID=1754191 RepID=A0A1Y1V7S1_9FUNG|nr:histone-fold-containing protein [Piromyces finnis]|eukprot:ORX47943.1 histone-fold-containing protein [Piromyces finnis]
MDLADEELSLPKATITKLVNEMMPEDITCPKETRDLLSECCVEFIHLIASEANEICEKDTKKTIAGEHVVSALESLGFEDYVSEIKEVLNEYQKQQKDREKRSSRLEHSALSQEELLQYQEELFRNSRMRMAQGVEETSLAAAQNQSQQTSDGIQQQNQQSSQTPQSSSAMDTETTVMAEGNAGLSNL